LSRRLSGPASSIEPVARKFGKRPKPGSGEPDGDPRELFGAPQLPRQSARPASSTPLADQLSRGYPGVDPGYVVLPRSIAESMSLPWQQQMAALLAQFHEQHSRLSWPIYRVVPSRYEKLVDLDEEQLAEAGYLVEIDSDGEMVYRERSGRKVEEPRTTTVLVSCLDPIPRPARRQAAPPAPAPGSPVTPQTSPVATPAPMNIGPAPVWRTVNAPAPAQSAPPVPPAPAVPSPAAPPPAPPQQQAPPVPPLPVPQAAPSVPPAAPPAPPRVPSVPRSEPIAPTPPRGVSLPPKAPSADRGWFDELAAAEESRKTEDPERGNEFGPTGDPTEIPYRYRP
jgi:hypothetical protein